MMINSKVAQQLSLFGLKPTQKMAQSSSGQLMIEVLELTESPKEVLIKHD